MKMQHLFCKEEYEAVEDNYGNHIVYRAFRSPCLVVANEVKTFALHPADLFYQCLFTVDHFKCISFKERKGCCKNELQAELIQHFKKKVPNADMEEINLAVCMVMQAIAEWLLRSGSKNLLLVKMLKEQMETDVSIKMNMLFRHGFQCVDEEKLADFMAEYMKSDEWISEELVDLLYNGKENTWQDTERTLRIADGKKRSMVVALRAFIESDWVEDINDGRPKNIEKAVNEILRLAFGEKKRTALAQTIKPSNDIDFEGSMNRIAGELAEKIKSFASEKKNKR